MDKHKLLAIVAAGALSVGFGSGYATSSMVVDDDPQNICEIERPQYCEPCGAAGMPPCPLGDSGWLCCSPVSGVCVEALGSCPSSHDFGYCENYTVDKSGAAICHKA